MKYSNFGSVSVKLSAVGLACVAALVACGGSSSDPVKVVSAAPAPIAISAATPAAKAVADAVVATVVTAAANQNFTFAAAIPNLATTSASGVKSTVTLAAGTTISLGKATSAAAPASFTIVTGGKTAKGDFKIGSCIFVVTSSDAPDVPVGTTITVDPCSLTVNVAGQNADGSERNAQANLVMGTSQSTTVSIPVTVTAAGEVQVGGTTVITVPTQNGTGP